jgi:mono/diheme cytochrome c family protein
MPRGSEITTVVGFIVTILCCCTSPEQQKFKQYYRSGQQLYERHCSNCHQTDGTGLGRVYPPLARADYLHANFEQTLCLMRYGIQGEITVNGKTYNQPMPGIPLLTDLEIAEIATYIYNSWGNKHGLVDVKQASKVLMNCRK